MSYGRVKLALFLGMAIYALIAVSIRGVTQDVYPVFSWSLFSHIPQPKVKFFMEIQQLGMDTYDPPLRFSQTKFVFDDIKRSPTDYDVPLQRLGEAIGEGDAWRIQKIRERLEKMFGERAFNYVVVEAKIDPMVYWKTGKYEVIRFMGEFSSSNL